MTIGTLFQCLAHEGIDHAWIGFAAAVFKYLSYKKAKKVGIACFVFCDIVRVFCDDIIDEASVLTYAQNPETGLYELTIGFSMITTNEDPITITCDSCGEEFICWAEYDVQYCSTRPDKTLADALAQEREDRADGGL